VITYVPVLLAAALLLDPRPGLPARRLTLAGIRPDTKSTAGRPRVSLRTTPFRAAPVDSLQLAAGWDLLAACLTAGLPVPVAIRAVADELPGCRSALIQTAELIALGAEADTAWQPALDLVATAPLARAARRTARSGAALAAVAGDLATDVRSAAGDLAEARAQRAAVHIAAPLGLCFLPAFLCLGVIPVIAGLAARLTTGW